MNYFYRNNDQYIRIPSKTVPTFENGIYYRKIYATSTDADQFVLLTEEPTDWQTSSYNYYCLEYSRILNPPTYQAGRYYRDATEESIIRDLQEPADWQTYYFGYYDFYAT